MWQVARLRLAQAPAQQRLAVQRLVLQQAGRLLRPEVRGSPGRLCQLLCQLLLPPAAATPSPLPAVCLCPYAQERRCRLRRQPRLQGRAALLAQLLRRRRCLLPAERQRHLPQHLGLRRGRVVLLGVQRLLGRLLCGAPSCAGLALGGGRRQREGGRVPLALLTPPLRGTCAQGDCAATAGCAWTNSSDASGGSGWCGPAQDLCGGNPTALSCGAVRDAAGQQLCRYQTSCYDLCKGCRQCLPGVVNAKQAILAAKVDAKAYAQAAFAICQNSTTDFWVRCRSSAVRLVLELCQLLRLAS